MPWIFYLVRFPMVNHLLKEYLRWFFRIKHAVINCPKTRNNIISEPIPPEFIFKGLKFFNVLNGNFKTLIDL